MLSTNKFNETEIMRLNENNLLDANLLEIEKNKIGIIRKIFTKIL